MFVLAPPGGAGSIAAQEMQIPRQPWDQISSYGGDRGLSPLYDNAGNAIEAMLKGDERWCVLPPVVSTATVSPDKPPCFEMHSGDSYYNNLPRTALAIRYTNLQSWGGRFRLLYNTSLVASEGDDLWLRVDGFRPPLTRIVGNRISEETPIGALPYPFSPSVAVKVANKGWCFATAEGPFLYVNDSWKRLRIPDWPGGAAQGVVTNPHGQIAVWANKAENQGTFVALLSGEDWASTTVPEGGTWTSGAIQAGGKVLLGRPGQFLVVTPGAAVKSQDEPVERGLDRQRQLEHQRKRDLTRRGQAWFTFDDGRQVMISGAPAIHPSGATLFAARDVAQRGVRAPGAGAGIGLVRILADGTTQWIDFETAAHVQVATWLDNGFLILAPGDGIFRLATSDDRPFRVGDASEAVEGSRLLGGDQNGRAYFDRDGAILVFNYKARRTDTIEPERIADLPPMLPVSGRHSRPPSSAVQTRAVVDRGGNIWFVASDGSVQRCRAGSTEARTVAEELDDVVALWPGRDGTVLAICDQGRVALLQDASKVLRASSLAELAEAHPGELLGAAPTLSRDERQRFHHKNQSQRSRPMLPWLSTGKCLWLTDGSFVYRVVVGGKDAASNELKVEKMCEGAFDILGPLGSGNLLLAKRESAEVAGNSNITSWYAIEDAEGKALLQGVSSPSREAPDGGILERPAEVSEDRLVDRNGNVAVGGGFDRVFRSNSFKDWQHLKDCGVPRFEFPAGYIWAYHSERVFPGYEVVGDNLRRSCLPTYCKHLTPLFADDKHVYCLTPLGISVLQFDPKDPQGDRAVHSYRIEWPSRPQVFVGRFQRRVFLLVGHDQNLSLVVAELPLLQEPAAPADVLRGSK
jgi:hypothetical protein